MRFATYNTTRQADRSMHTYHAKLSNQEIMQNQKKKRNVEREGLGDNEKDLK